MKAVFIENDFEIEADDKEYMEGDLNFSFDQFFDKVVVDAARLKPQVWMAIKEYNYIFLNTAFIGDSSYLLEEMAEMALRKKIKDKVILNFRTSDAKLFLSERAYRLLHILIHRNNVKYLSSDSEEFEEIVSKIIQSKS